MKLKSKYHYATMHASSLFDITHVPMPKDSFLTEDAEVKALRDLLMKGYRWIRTDGETAIFEKELTGVEFPPAKYTYTPTEAHDGYESSKIEEDR